MGKRATQTEKRALIQMQDYETFNNELEISLTPSRYNLRWPERLRKCWANLLKSFYNIDPNFATRDPKTFTQEVRDTVRVAEEMEVTFTGGMRGIEEALLRLGQVLFHAIVMYPASWAALGKRMRSADIYQESIIHIVGRWNSLGPMAAASLESCTLELCKIKHQELVLKKRSVECRMLSHYPPSLHRGEDGDLGCTAYANDIYMWMAIAFFRQFYCYAVIDRKTHHALDGGASFYRSIYSMDLYLNARERAFFNVVFPMSTRGCEMFNTKLQELKVDMKSFVAPLLVNRCRYIFPQVPSYLTCCQIDKEDLPWDERTTEADDQVVKPEEENPEVVNMQDIAPHNGGTIMQPLSTTEATPGVSNAVLTQNVPNTQMPDNNTGVVNNYSDNNNNSDIYSTVYNNNYGYVNGRDNMLENVINPYND